VNFSRIHFSSITSLSSRKRLSAARKEILKLWQHGKWTERGCGFLS
jgi:hypothetical protein